MIFALEGPRAVGKTTLLNNLENLNPDIKVFPGYKYQGKSFDMTTFEGFCENQKIYCQQKLRQYSELNDNDINVVTRGTENIIFFSLTYPQIMGYNWNVISILQNELTELEAAKSDTIIYLDASNEVILARSERDMRQRPNIQCWLELWSNEMRKFFLKQPRCIFIDTNFLTEVEVATEVLKRINDTCMTKI